MKKFKNLEKQVIESFFAYVVYSDRKDLAKRTVSHKNLKDRAYEIAINPKHDG